MKYNYRKELVTDRELILSPYYTVCANNEYYLVCRDESDDEIKHLRIDKFKDIIIADIEITPPSYGFSISEYTTKYIYLNGENIKTHNVSCTEDEIDSMIDHFGENISFEKKDDIFEARIKATDSQLELWYAVRGRVL